MGRSWRSCEGLGFVRPEAQAILLWGRDGAMLWKMERRPCPPAVCLWKQQGVCGTGGWSKHRGQKGRQVAVGRAHRKGLATVHVGHPWDSSHNREGCESGLRDGSCNVGVVADQPWFSPQPPPCHKGYDISPEESQCGCTDISYKVTSHPHQWLHFRY